MNVLRTRTGLLLVTAAVLPLAVTAIAERQFTHDLLGATAEERARNALEDVAVLIQDLDQRSRSTASWLAGVPALHHDASLHDLLHVDPNLRILSVLDRSGQVIASSEPALVGSLRGLRLLSDLLATGDAGSLVEGGIASYIAPVRDGKWIAGAVLLELTMGKLADQMRSATALDVAAVVRDEQGAVLWRTARAGRR